MHCTDSSEKQEKSKQFVSTISKQTLSSESERERTNPRQVSGEVEGESAPAHTDLELPIDFAGAVGGGASDGAEAARDGVAAVESLGGLLGFVKKLLEAVVGAAPRVLQSLAGDHALSEAVDVAALEGSDGRHVAGGEDCRRRRRRRRKA